MNPSSPAELDVPMIMRIGAARLTAGLDRMTRLDLKAHGEVFGPLPRTSADDLIAMAAQVDLRGQGGAAFPFARKLQVVVDTAKKTGQPTIVVVNAAEGEPGSFKDKMLMIRSPYLILSGAALVAEAIDAEEIVVGVTSSELANRSIEAAIAAEPGLRKMVRVVQQPERFISGQSGALIRGINGKKPLPPGRKTLAAERGVDDLPTLLSNASTFAQVSVLALLGPARFAAVGVPEEPGTVLLSVSGSAKHAAVVECPTGVPLGAVLDICQAPAGDGVLVGGYHGMWLDAEAAYQVPVSREGLAAAGGTLGAGIVLPLGDGTCPLGEVSRVANYLAGESAGQCGPCRLGLPSIARALAALVDGSGGIEALDVARRAAATVNGRGSCAHPDGTTRFVLSALEVFAEDLAAHVFHSTCGRPVRGVLPLPEGPETADARQLIVDWVRCEGHGLCAHLVPELVHLDKTGYPVIMPIPVPPWLEKDAQQAVDMCPALALRLAADPKKRAAGQGGHTSAPLPLQAQTARTSLLGVRPAGGRSITAG
ncbi:NADH-quinone oxidoreductase subunit NuoF family protein [Trebonia sp.]|uniref:NADH-quinone oxidoreductase subunit NuoF family protein n=1 Tax=Trebonia sp. TaxID=2767075 RepID=UPI00260CE554|nr:NADH-quinone oxidoreductase subunit NuoF family protein [Trebonia sp.]